MVSDPCKVEGKVTIMAVSESMENHFIEAHPLSSSSARVIFEKTGLVEIIPVIPSF